MSRHVSFDVSEEDRALIADIVERAVAEGLVEDAPDAREWLRLDLSTCKAQGCDIDFARLLGFGPFSFSHDIQGIINTLDRDTGRLMWCFIPRSARGSGGDW